MGLIAGGACAGVACPMPSVTVSERVAYAPSVVFDGDCEGVGPAGELRRVDRGELV